MTDWAFVESGGRFPFTKRFWKFRLGCKWNMIFWLVPLKNFRQKWNFSENVVPLSRWKFSDGTACSIYGFRKGFTRSMPLTTISSVRKNGGYPPSASSVPSISSVVFHLPKNFGNSGWDVNGYDSGSCHCKFSGLNGISEKVDPFTGWNLSNGKFVYRLHIFRLYCFYHQFHTFRGFLSGQGSLATLEWNLWQMERKQKFPVKIFRIFL